MSRGVVLKQEVWERRSHTIKRKTPPNSLNKVSIHLHQGGQLVFDWGRLEIS